MTPKISQLVEVNVTPDQLREIACVLEEKFIKAQLGDEVPRYRIHGLNNVILDLVVDQEEMHAEKYREQRKNK